jgi:hypothetical protein
MSEVHTCPTCGHEATAYWKRLSTGNVDSLVKFRNAIGRLNRNEIHTYRDMDGTEDELTAAQKMNWTSLRFHGLVAKVKDENGDHKRGYWLLTSRGASFLRGELALPKSVKTLNNRVIGYSDEYTDIRRIRATKDLPYFDDIWDIRTERQPLDLVQTEMAL